MMLRSVADHNYHGDQCTVNDKVCWNTAGGADGVHDGCSGSVSSGPLCVGGLYQEVDASFYGEYCVLCLNAQPSDDYEGDWGCNGATPRCVLEDGITSPGVLKGGMECAPLIGGPCKNTVHDHNGGQKDENCNEANKPVCFGASGFSAAQERCVSRV
jgi:hypothetical protein